MRKRTRWTAALVPLALLLSLPAAPARGEGHLGVRGGIYAEDADPFVGVEVLGHLGATGWRYNPNLELVFLENGELLTVNGDFYYRIEADDAPVQAWAGGGLALLFRDRDRGRAQNDTDVGVNLLAGVGFPGRTGLKPYIQGKVLLSDHSEAVLAVGIRF